MTVFCTILGTGCILYYLVLALYAGPAFNFGWFWLAVGAAFLLAAILRRFPDRMPMVWISGILLVCLAAGFIVLGVMSAFVISGMHTTAPEGIRTAIVLGAQVRGTRPSLALARRLDAAAAAQESAPPKAPMTLILSGGQGPGEEISEAECMWNELTARGVDEKLLKMEDQSTSTLENLQFSDRLYGCAGEPCAVITNDFHLYRALRIARNAGYQEVYGIAAQGDALMEVHYVIREAVALLYGKLRGIY
jgi:uncharacterized SAM-binding protein YcdF (DUF218 family)